MKQTMFRSHELENQCGAVIRVAEQKAQHIAASFKFRTRQQLPSKFRSFHESVQSQLDTVGYQLQVLSNNHSTQKGLASKQEDEARLEKEITVGEDKAINLSGSATAESNGKKVKRILLSILLIFLCIGDSIFNQAGYERLFELSLLTSSIISLVIAGVLAYFAHDVIPKYVQAGDSARRMMNSLLLAGMVFLLLGYIRISHTFIFNMDNVLKLFAFALISELLFFAACKIGIHLLASKNTPAMDYAEQASIELKETKAKLKQTKSDLQKLRSDWQEHEAYSAALMEYGEGLKLTCIHKCHAIFWDYIKTAQNHGMADVDQDIFNFDAYPFTFETTLRPASKSAKGQVVTVLLMLSMLAGMAACTDPNKGQGDIAVMVLMDNSLSVAAPDTTQLLHLAGLDSDIWGRSVYMGFGTISDVDFNPVYSHTLESEDRLTGNLQQREQKVHAFTGDIHGSLQKVTPSPDAELANSVVYRSIARHAIELQKMDYKRRVLVVYSDLQNHDSDVSFYSPKGKKLLKSYPDSLEHIFLRQVPLERLDMTIMFIHRPDGHGKNSEYLSALGFFTEMFQRHGVVVESAASLPTP